MVRAIALAVNRLAQPAAHGAVCAIEAAAAFIHGGEQATNCGLAAVTGAPNAQRAAADQFERAEFF